MAGSLGGGELGPIICRDSHYRSRDCSRACRAARAARSDATLATATADAPLFPQRLINVPVRRGFDWRASDAIRNAERAAVAALDGGGRVLLRPSGTEPVLRVMVEAREADAADTHARDIADAVAKAAA